MVSLLIVLITPAFSQSPYGGSRHKDEQGSTNPGPQYHMMLYEQAEKNAEEQYAVITKTPEENAIADEKVNDIDQDKEENTAEK